MGEKKEACSALDEVGAGFVGSKGGCDRGGDGKESTAETEEHPCGVAGYG